MDLFALVSPLREPKKVLLQGFFVICFLSVSLCFAEAGKGLDDSSPNQLHNKPWHSSAVQVLAYKGDSLLNQGSGVVVAVDGVVVTSSHLLESADRYIIKDETGQESPAVIVNKNDASDIAVLRAGGMVATPVQFSFNPVSEKDTLEIAGYWHLSPEEPRSSFFGLSNKPRFVAAVVPNIQTTKALLGDGTGEEYLKLVTSVGRGAYGAPLANRCGQLVGLVRPKPGKTLKELWQPHTPLGAVATKVSNVEQLLVSLSISVEKASEACLSVIDQQKAAQTAKQQEIDQAKKKTRQAEEEAKKAKEAAEKEKQAREDAEKGREEISTIVSDVNSKAELIDSENSEIKEKNQTLLWSVVAAIIIGLLLVIILVSKRRKDLLAANMALQAASASFGDCRFEGRDSSGAPMAFFVFGKDLMQRANGLILGRNPDVAQVVIADDTVSRQHAQLFVKDRYLHIRDLGSTGGTRINGVAVSDEGAAAIAGDVVEFGQVRCTLTISDGDR